MPAILHIRVAKRKSVPILMDASVSTCKHLKVQLRVKSLTVCDKLCGPMRVCKIQRLLNCNMPQIHIVQYIHTYTLTHILVYTHISERGI